MADPQEIAKVVFVEVTHGAKLFELEVNLEEHRRKVPKGVLNCDQELLIKGLCEKKPDLAYLFKSVDSSYKEESRTRPGKFVERGYKSPIRTETIKCVLPENSSSLLRNLNLKENMTFGSGSLSNTARLVRSAMGTHETFNDLSIGESTFNDIISSSFSLLPEQELQALVGNDCSHSPGQRDSTAQRNAESSLPVAAQRETEPTAVPDNYNARVVMQKNYTTQGPPLQQIFPSTSTLEITSHSHSSALQQAVTSTGTRQITTNSELERSSRANNQVKLLNPKNKSHDTRDLTGSRLVDFLTFEEPTYFGEKINTKLSKGARLTLAEESVVSREYCRSIRRQTRAPLPASIRAVVDLLYNRYQINYIEDEDATKKYWTDKLTNCLYRMRQSDGERITKGGKPRKGKASDLQPAAVPFAVASQDQQDEFPEHVKRMKDLWTKSPTSEGVLSLFRLTHAVRRNMIMTPEDSSSMELPEFIETYAPMLRDSYYFFLEVDLILGQGTTEYFVSTWKKTIPKVIQIAKEKTRKSKALRQVLDRDIGDQALLAIELLPILIGTNAKKSGNLEVYLFQQIDESADLCLSIRNPRRNTPFIILCGSTFHLIVDQQPILKIDKDPALAFFSVVAAYYVFNIVYSDAVEPTLLFAQSFLLKKPDSFTQKCARVRNFVGQLEEIPVESKSE